MNGGSGQYVPENVERARNTGRGMLKERGIPAEWNVMIPRITFIRVDLVITGHVKVIY